MGNFKIYQRTLHFSTKDKQDINQKIIEFLTKVWDEFFFLALVVEKDVIEIFFPLKMMIWEFGFAREAGK